MEKVNIHNSILRYPGGKSRLAPWFKDNIIKNSFFDYTYIEPYAGGAGIALYLLFNDVVKKIHINDIDPVIYAIWYNVLNDTENFLKLMYDTKVSISTWQKQKEILLDTNSDSLNLGFAGFFLNRTNISGVIKGGAIGGLAQTGKYLIDCRFNKKDLEKKIIKIADKAKKIKISNCDAIKLLKKLNGKKNNLIYIDPPYYHKGSQLYRNYYKHSDHENIAKTINMLTNPWVVTYDNCEQIKQLYNANKQIEFSISYMTGKNNKGQELMIYDNINIYSKPNLYKKDNQ